MNHTRTNARTHILNNSKSWDNSKYSSVQNLKIIKMVTVVLVRHTSQITYIT